MCSNKNCFFKLNNYDILIHRQLKYYRVICEFLKNVEIYVKISADCWTETVASCIADFTLDILKKDVAYYD